MRLGVDEGVPSCCAAASAPAAASSVGVPHVGNPLDAAAPCGGVKSSG
jgi:hypothetical protein